MSNRFDSDSGNVSYDDIISENMQTDWKKHREYPVYRNDIKFKKHRNIDPMRAMWSDDVKDDYNNKETDTIDYRMEECKREKYETLILSHMNDENCFVKLFQDQNFQHNKHKIQHVFADDCDIKNLPDLTELTSLITLDISRNNLTKLSNLPDTLEELIVNNNKLTKLTNNLPNLKRLNASYNEIYSINYGGKLESVFINNNPIDNIIRLDNLHFLDMSHTKIRNIQSFPKLKYLDCSNTLLTVIPKMDKLLQLLCNNSSVNDISLLTSLESLDMIDSCISTVHYIKSLYKLIYRLKHINISRYYIMYNRKQNENNIVEIVFKKNTL
jgi:Leucine-rich repeat (LRR) protein